MAAYRGASVKAARSAEQADKGLRRDYDQTALVAQVWTSAAIPQRAFERFTDQGPLALLPQDEGYALVWCVRPTRAAELLGLPDAVFLAELAALTRFAPGPLRAGYAARRLSRLLFSNRAAFRFRAHRQRSATPRKRCTRWPGKDSISACAMRRCWHNCWHRRLARRRWNVLQRNADPTVA